MQQRPLRHPELVPFEDAAVEIATKAAGLLRQKLFGDVAVEFKDKHQRDPVTAVDRAVEQLVREELRQRFPAHGILGEEGTGEALTSEYLWVLDPLDGTANFAAGRDRFAMIVCLVHDTVAVGGWILDVPRGQMAVALKGEGVTLDGAAVKRSKPARPPIGFVGYKVKKEFDRQLPPASRRTLGRVSTLNCAGAEYLEILAGRADFNLYRMTKPWDHAAGTLMIGEAGGEAQRFDGKSYAPAQPINGGLITAIHPQTLAQVRTLFEAVRMPLLAGLPKT